MAGGPVFVRVTDVLNFSKARRWRGALTGGQGMMALDPKAYEKRIEGCADLPERQVVGSTKDASADYDS